MKFSQIALQILKLLKYFRSMEEIQILQSTSSQVFCIKIGRGS